ncbi:glycosyltransferase family 1 protein [Opitutales bacterium ASA1]|uniref:glycosyltransferase family 4 protein n=1 Tax=Congregicoccus parvus TaxID=3081749 RepID=UPI002B2AC576|nr:glycosyltransferase family 1 protein [Opitutales bacterium ASA1]
MKPRVLFDFEIFSDQSRGGITRYVLELATRLADEIEVRIHAGFHRSRELRARSDAWIVGRYLPVVPKTGELRRRLNAALTRRAIASFQPDIVHRTYYRHAAAYPGSHADVVTLYDLVYFQDPWNVPGGDVLKHRIRNATQRADRVICISDHTRQDAQHELGLPREKTSVVHLGTPLLPRPHGHAPVPSPYLLHVGLRAGYKNFQLTLRALASDRTLAPYHLLAFGGPPFSDSERADIASFGLTSRVAWLPGNDLALATAYTHASALVYPSAYEGFGLPLLEAMSLRCPVVCSRSSSLPEVGGEAAEYFDPSDPTDLARALHRALAEPERAHVLRDLGARRAAGFTWERCAAETLALYRTLRAS